VKTYLSYYKKAFELLKAHTYIFFISAFIVVFFTIVNYVSTHTNKPPFYLIIAEVILYICTATLSFFQPILFQDASENRKRTFKQIAALIIRTIPRAMKITSFVYFLIFLFIFGNLVLNKSRSSLIPVSLAILALSLLSPSIKYVLIEYMIHQGSLINSIRKSISFTFKNLSFTIIPIPLIFAASVINVYKIIPLTENLLLKCAYYFIITYVSLLITGSFFLYYKERTKR